MSELVEVALVTDDVAAAKAFYRPRSTRPVRSSVPAASTCSWSRGTIRGAARPYLRDPDGRLVELTQA